MPDTDEALVRRHLDISTAHLPAKLRYSNLNAVGWLSAETLRYGHLVWVPDDPKLRQDEAEEPIPVEVLTVLEYAAAAGCDFILFDRDASVCSALPVYGENGEPL